MAVTSWPPPVPLDVIAASARLPDFDAFRWYGVDLGRLYLRLILLLVGVS